jgi:hypothetical protein
MTKDVLKYLQPNAVIPIDMETTTALVNALKEALAQRTEQEPVALPCCGYTDASAVKWNPLNGVVQCHNCGQTYTPPQRTEQEPVPTLEDLEQEIYQNTRNFISRDVMEWMLRRYYTHLPQRTEQEPCVHAKTPKGCYRVRCQLGDKCVDDEMSFRTTPPQRKPLTDEEMKKIWYAMQNIMGWYSFQEIARAIEAAHGIKENT